MIIDVWLKILNKNENICLELDKILYVDIIPTQQNCKICYHLFEKFEDTKIFAPTLFVVTLAIAFGIG